MDSLPPSAALQGDAMSNHSTPANSRPTTPSTISDRTTSTLCDGMSLYSYTSSVDREFILKDLHGRVVNNTNELYLLPADVNEHGRLDIQHEVWKTKIGALYWPSDLVRKILAQRGPEVDPPAVLDIGTGSGVWALDMAEEFAHAEIVGIDLVPPNLQKTPPSNCRFECDDVNLGLTHYRNCFDVIHARCILSGVEDPTAFFNEMHDILRPGGVLLVLEGNFLSDEDGNNLTRTDAGALDISAMAFLAAKLAQEVEPARWAKRAQIDGKAGTREPVVYYQSWMRRLTQWKAQDHLQLPVAVGPWIPNMSGRDRHAAELLRQNLFLVCSSVRPAFLHHGYSAEEVDEWIRKAQDEVFNVKARTYVKWQASYALKAGAAEHSM